MSSLELASQPKSGRPPGPCPYFPTVACAADAYVFDAPCEAWCGRHVVCVAADEQWESGALVVFDQAASALYPDGRVFGAIVDATSEEAFPVSLATGCAVPLSLVSSMAREGASVAIGLRAAARVASAPQTSLHLTFSSSEVAAEWVRAVKDIWPNPFLDSDGENATYGVIAVFSILQFIPVIGPIFALPVAIWNCYAMRKRARQQIVSGEKDCCTPLCSRLCCLPPTKKFSMAAAPAADEVTINPLAAAAANK